MIDNKLLPVFRYRPELDGLRAVAVVAVLLFHAGLGVPGGFVGVDVFFVLSGYLITSLIVRDIEAGTFSFLDFWERRARRILPASTFLVICTLVAGSLLLMPADYEALGNSSLATALFGANVFFWRNANYFSTAADEMPLLHMWSLAVEEQFYFIVPLLLWAAAQYSRFTRSGMLAAVGVACAASFGVAVWMVPRMPAAAFYLLPARAWELGLGSLIALWPHAWMPAGHIARSAAAWIGLAATGVPCVCYDRATPFPGIAALAPCLGAALYILSTTRPAAFPHPLPVRLLASRPCVAVGLVSYSLYLWHWPLFAFSRYWAVEPLTLATRIAICILSVVLAAVSWWMVETPFRTRSCAATRRGLLWAAACAVGFVAVAGSVVAFKRGFPQRFGPEMLTLTQDSLQSLAKPSATLADLKAGQLPVLGDPDAPLALLGWGDSHAMAILPGIEKMCREHGVSAVYAVHSSTAPVLDYEHTNKYSRKEKAPLFAAAVVDYVRNHHIPNVLLAARWSGYLDAELGPAPEMGAAKGGGMTLIEALCGTVSSLAAAGTQPYVLSEVPNHPVNVPKALRFSRMFGVNAGSWSRKATSHSQLASRLDTAVPELQKRGGIVVDVSPMLLAEDRQSYLMERDGSAFYTDEHHLSRYGALHIAPGLARCVSRSPLSASSPRVGPPNQ